MKKFWAIIIGASLVMSIAAPSFAATAVKNTTQTKKTSVTIKTDTVYKTETIEETRKYDNDRSYGGHGYTTQFGNYNSPYGNIYYHQQDVINAGWTIDKTYTTSWVIADVHRRTLQESYSNTVFVVDDVSYETIISYEYIDGELVRVREEVETTVGHDETTTTSVFLNESATIMYDPLILNISGSNKISTAKNEWLPHAPGFYHEFASKFDLTGDGIADNCEWVSNNPDAFLVMPENGRVTSVLQLFGNLGGYANGFDKLATLCDADQNGWVEGEELSGLALWIDANRDGICQPAEIKSLESFGIARISTSEKNFKGSYETTDGKKHIMWAWWPSIK